MKILSYNIQAAIHSSGYVHYLWQWPRQLLPTPAKRATLARIAAFINGYDLVCLQEVELGGLRNGFKNQVEQLRAHTDFKFLCYQLNRRVGQLSQHGNLILAKEPLRPLLKLPLPGKITGRGLLAVGWRGLVVANTHLSLGPRDQRRQVDFIGTMLRPWPRVLLTGDFNCEPGAEPLQRLQRQGFQRLGGREDSFPSWRPRHCLDHGLVRGLSGEAHVLPFQASDHLPLEIVLH